MPLLETLGQSVLTLIVFIEFFAAIGIALVIYQIYQVKTRFSQPVVYNTTNHYHNHYENEVDHETSFDLDEDVEADEEPPATH